MKKNLNEQKSESDILSSLKFCVFDLETTGGNTKTDKIIEIGLVNIDGKEIGEKKSYLIDPERKIPEFIQKLTSIKQADVEGCPKIDNVIEEILEFIGDRVLIAHNSSFDVPFLNSVLKRLGRPELTNKSICTNLMTKYLIPSLMNSNLNYMSKIFKIKHTKAHRALDDADATAKLFINYLDIFESKGVSKVNHLYYPKNRFELDLVNYKKDTPEKEIKAKISKMPAPYIVSFKGENGVILFAFPCANDAREVEYIMDKVSSIQWETMTIKLIGPFTEVLLKYTHLFAKLDLECKKEVMTKLWDLHLVKTERKDLLAVAAEIEKYDFLIINHLVPEQYTIYPLASLGHKSELIFRYPGHKKKLAQYINSRGNKVASGKTRKVNVPPQLKDFIDCYMAKCQTENKEVFFFDKTIAMKKVEEFYEAFEKFAAKNKNTYNYPQKYI
ncbi:PolC-type DNA polymerase III [Bacteriovorax sp. Seq25_V]|uniref:3'-5' exonuclease n=1 Tax=Bacteriovorax sp. Seq25_V TaxID=1201288 RepID=UPI00038A3EC6|nr:3'-5' exonuclease [Bacteriovorax sp. Seq25_V]EQC45610.1 exonuclease [Bacteriovorax sp. Seq25_V]